MIFGNSLSDLIAMIDMKADFCCCERSGSFKFFCCGMRSWIAVTLASLQSRDNRSVYCRNACDANQLSASCSTDKLQLRKSQTRLEAMRKAVNLDPMRLRFLSWNLTKFERWKSIGRNFCFGVVLRKTAEAMFGGDKWRCKRKRFGGKD